MRTTQYLDDEHMRLYEWSGAGTGMQHVLPSGSKRSHAWHASYGVLAVLTSLLVLGCDNKGPVEQAGEQVGRAAQDMKEEAAKPGDEAAAEARPEQEAERSPAEAGEKPGQTGQGVQKP